MRSNPWLGREWLSVLTLAAASIGAPAETDVAFRPGDVVIRTREHLRLYRAGKELRRWGEPWHVCEDGRGRLWAGAIKGQQLVLRGCRSTVASEDVVSRELGKGAALFNILHCGDSLYAVYTVPHEEEISGPWHDTPKQTGRISGRWIHVLPFSLSSQRFRRAIPLRDDFGQSEILAKERKLTDGKPVPKGVRPAMLVLVLFDAAITPSGELWLSTQGKITSYRLGGLPSGLLTILDPAKIEGYAQRTKKIDWWISQHGNGTGITTLSDTEVLVVNGNPPGWLTVVNTDRPRDSVHLTRSVFPDDPQVCGLRPVLATRDEILVAHTHPKVAKVYRVSRTTGEILGTFAEGVIARGMIEIR